MCHMHSVELVFYPSNHYIVPKYHNNQALDDGFTEEGKKLNLQLKAYIYSFAPSTPCLNFERPWSIFFAFTCVRDIHYNMAANI